MRRCGNERPVIRSAQTRSPAWLDANDVLDAGLLDAT